VALLEVQGVHGPAVELEAAVEAVMGHALTLHLLGSYLCDAYGGDVWQRKQVSFEVADAEQGGHAFRVMDSYVAWFETSGATGREAMALLRLMGLFDRPAAASVFEALLAAPALVGLTEGVVEISDVRCNLAVKRLESVRLLTVVREHHLPKQYDAHPLIREYFAHRLRKQAPEAWRAGHQRLFEHLSENTEFRPSGLVGLQPLYRAVGHGCFAGLHSVVLVELYLERILRGTDVDGYYSINQLGAFGADLDALSYFFELPWERSDAQFSDVDHGWLLHEVAFRLRALGRLQESLGAWGPALEVAARHGLWQRAAIICGNMSELMLTLAGC
jgi:hypothetical protein